MNKIWSFMVQYKWYIITILVIIIIIIAYKKYSMKPMSAPYNKPTAPSDYTSSGGSSSQWGNDSFPLKKWSKGENVKKLQTALNKSIMNKKLAVDGAFGPITESAVIALKKQIGTATGGEKEITQTDWDLYIKDVVSGDNKYILKDLFIPVYFNI